MVKVQKLIGQLTAVFDAVRKNDRRIEHYLFDLFIFVNFCLFFFILCCTV